MVVGEVGSRREKEGREAKIGGTWTVDMIQDEGKTKLLAWGLYSCSYRSLYFVASQLPIL